MGLAAIEAKLLEYVGLVMVEQCGRPEPAHVLRYQGTLADQCCPEEGVLSAHWEGDKPKDPRGQQKDQSCLLVAPIALRYVTCWHLPNDPRAITDAEYVRWDTDAAALADLAHCVSLALCRLGCSPVRDPLFADVLGDTGCQEVKFTGAEPAGAGATLSAGCAGVVWKVTVRLGGDTGAT